MTLVGSVLGTSSEAARDQNALALLNYGFAEFRMVKPVVAGQVLARPTVKDSPGVRATVIAGATFQRVVSRAYDVRLRVVAPAQLAGPLRRDAVVGYVGVVIGARTMARIPLLLERALPAVSTVTLVGRFIGTWIVFGLAILVAALSALVLARRRWRMRITPGETLEAG
jgi:D-alanyl-D-alanine carboxypeptidase (penicillin-binding protein 5/6)